MRWLFEKEQLITFLLKLKTALIKQKAGVIPAFLLIVLPCALEAKGFHFNYDEACQKAHSAILAHDEDAARNHLQNIDNQNLVKTYLTNYFDCIRLLSYENEAVYDSLIERQEQRIEELQKGPSSSPFYRLTQAEIHLQLAVTKAKFGNYWSAGWDLVKTYRLLDKNEKVHPDFLPNQKTLLPIRAAIGTLPGQFQWIVRLLGFEGSLESANQHYAAVLSKYRERPEFQAFYKEAGFIRGLMQYHLMSQPEEAWKTVSDMTADYRNNSISAFFRANMAIRIKRKKALLKTLKPYKNRSHDIPHLDYQIGNAHLYQLKPSARKYFGRYITAFEGHSFVKDAYLKIAWVYLLKGDRDQYQNAVFLAEHKGKKVRGADKQAIRESDHYNEDNLPLLKARLRFDGGYYQKGLHWLEKFSAGSAETLSDRMEYHYRRARIYQKLDQEDKALREYREVLGFEEVNGTYYQPAAYFYSGKVHEEKGDGNAAKTKYKQVLEYSDYPYERSFSQKAKAGLERIKDR